ncbi:hypothetical protein FOA52_008477 [Chlamydomonas sp. UWO 241]|nr:hypothetical protein FOA52_008477 [Chlamydomonas sp. UWO 241]
MEEQEAATKEGQQQVAGAAPLLPPLPRLLTVCGQSPDPADVPSMEKLLTGMGGDLRRVFKVGEGSYGEAFKHAGHVVKIIPIEGPTHVNGYAQKSAGNMTGEALVALTLSGLRRECDADGARREHVAPSFVDTSRVAICHGPYPKLVARAWHKWDTENGSENDAVDGPGFGPGSASARSQLYLILAMADCGRDLEKHALSGGLLEARSILLQTVLTLAVGEAAVEFEHRDLHWGNLLIAPALTRSIAFRLDDVDIMVESAGVRASLIDFSASRLIAADGTLAFCDLSQDPEIFEGPKGQIQFDTYRYMAALTGGDWATPTPGTNCLWMAYLAETLAATKIGGISRASAAKRALREFKKRCVDYSSCRDMLQDELFEGLWARA